MTTPRWLKRLGSSLLIGGQAVAATLKRTDQHGGISPIS